MSTLYELTEQYQQLLQLLEDPDEDPRVIADTMEGIEGELEDKADGYGRIIRQLEAESASLKAEEERLARKRKAADRQSAAFLIVRFRPVCLSFADCG